MQPNALEVTGLTKSFDKPAVCGLDFAVRAGEFYALLGPNGAGKTTSLRMVAGLLQPDAGTIEVFGTNALADPVGVKRIMAWVPDEPMIYDRLTPRRLGQIVALYEHRVFVEGVILGINSYDQWGVELGKELATALGPLVSGDAPIAGKDGSTEQLLRFVHANQG